MKRTVLGVIVVVAALLSSAITTAQAPSRADDVGIRGYVIDPHGAPVTSGRVVLSALMGRGALAAIEDDGRFRLIPAHPGEYVLSVTVANTAPYRANVTVPASRTLNLPIIQLQAPTYFKARFVDQDGTPLLAPRLVRRSISIDPSAPPSADVRDIVDADGTITIGPLPLGRTTLAVNSPPFALTRLSDLLVTGKDALLDGGVIVVRRGSSLDVELLDAAGAPVAGRNVNLEDVQPLSPVSFPASKTDAMGLARFDRIAAGRYRIRTWAIGPCSSQPLQIARTVSSAGSGSQRVRMIIDGVARVRVSTGLGPLVGASIALAPEIGNQFQSSDGASQGPPPSCSGTSDGTGRVSFRHFPPGPARLTIKLPNSTYIRRVAVPQGEQEMVVTIPDGLLSVRAASAQSRKALGGALATFNGGGAQVQAVTTPLGDALLEGLAAGGGSLAVDADGHDRVELQLSESGNDAIEVSLPPAPTRSLMIRVTTPEGKAAANAVVRVASDFLGSPDHIIAAGPEGTVTLPNLPSGSLRLVAHADGLAAAVAQVGDDRPKEITLTLMPGYRIVADVQLDPSAGPYTVRTITSAGVAVDHLLDLQSDRAISKPGTLSIGTLAAGDYVVTLTNGRGTWQQRIRLVDRNAWVAFP